MRGYLQGRFSFNVKGGRCEACSGDGTIKIEMNFLPDVYVPCEVCHGARYNRETLEVHYKGKTIAEVLDMPIEEAADFFAAVPPIARHMTTLGEVGLGYVRLGQPATTLSGGEAQRVKLASELQKRSTGRTVYVLDEPTTGLHFEDIRKLLHVLSGLVDKGNTVLVIEHNLDVIKTADWLIDMGPEGGSRGGYVVAEGTPEEVAAVGASYTGTFLKPLLEGRGAKQPRGKVKPVEVTRPVTKAAAKKVAAAERAAKKAAAAMLRPRRRPRKKAPAKKAPPRRRREADDHEVVTASSQVGWLVSDGMTAINRRRALSGSAAVAVGVPLLAACGDDSASTATDPTSSSTPSEESSSPSEDAGSSGGGAALASTSDVPVGGCFVVAASKIVLTQPTEGDFKAFTAVCTHQGCIVESSTEGEIPCPCHGSRFSLDDGSPQSGPATAALAPVEITVDGDSITQA